MFLKELFGILVWISNRNRSLLACIGLSIALLGGAAERISAQCKKKSTNKLIEQGLRSFDQKNYAAALEFYNKALKNESDCGNLHVNIGQALRLSEQTEAAIKTLTHALTLNIGKSERVLANRSLAAIYLEKRDFPATLRYGEELVKIDPNDIQGWDFIVRANHSLEKYPEAAKACAEILRIDPSQNDIRQFKGQLHFTLQQYREALTDLSEAHKRDSQNPELTMLLGESYLMLGDYAQASDIFQKAVKLKPDYGDAYYDLGTLHLVLKQYQQAVDAYEKAVKNKPRLMAESFYGIAISALALGKHQKAISSFNLALEQKPTILPEKEFKGFIFLQLATAHGQLAEFQKAISYLRQLKEIDFKSERADIDLSWWYSLLGENEAAVEAARRAIEKDPKDFMGYTNRCRANYLLRLYNDALADCRKALEIKPEHGESLFYLGRVLKEKKQLKEAEEINKKAIAVFEKELKVRKSQAERNTQNSLSREMSFGIAFEKEEEPAKPADQPGVINFNFRIESPFSPYLLGNAYSDDKQLMKAAAAYQESLRRSPRFPLALFNLGVTYFNLKRKDLALAQYQELLKFDRQRAEELKKIIDPPARKK